MEVNVVCVTMGDVIILPAAVAVEMKRGGTNTSATSLVSGATTSSPKTGCAHTRRSRRGCDGREEEEEEEEAEEEENDDDDDVDVSCSYGVQSESREHVGTFGETHDRTRDRHT